MARSHHRKKHKEQLRQFKHKEGTTYSTPKSKAANIFAIVGAIVGLAVSYFATEGSILWISVGLIVGGIAGYLIGRKVDTNN
jgi:VIT1/CCC1 family predicted Fe2+/Mn2+ transporter